MAVKVLITRRFREGTLVDIMMALTKLRVGAMGQAGYVTGQTLISRSDPQKMVVISTWESEKSWEKWRDSPERLALDHQLEPFLLDPTRYEVYAPGTVPA